MAARHSDTRKLYQLLKDATGKRKIISTGARGEDGSFLSRINYIIARGWYHFQKLLDPSHDIPSTQTPPDNSTTALQPSNPNHNLVPPSQQAPYSNFCVHPPPFNTRDKRGNQEAEESQDASHTFYSCQSLQSCPYSCRETTEILLLNLVSGMVSPRMARVNFYA
ncbi:hypothetical protein QYM36_017101, partial [Artemia franciscana]